MSSRLASFRGPSTPSASPVHAQPQSPASPSRSTESTYHRKARSLLQELQAITETWDDLVLIDGLKSARSLVDTRNDLENALAQIPDRQPRSRMVGPRLALMDTRIAELDVVITKLTKQFRRMNLVIDNFETLLIEAHKLKGWQWVQQEPLWMTWSLEKFVTEVPQILVPYHRSLNTHIELVQVLRKHSVSFDDSKDAIRQWAAQEWLQELGWEAKWEDLCEVEVDRWNTSK